VFVFPREIDRIIRTAKQDLANCEWAPFLQKSFKTVRCRGLDVASGHNYAVGLAMGQADFLKTLSGDDPRGSCQKGGSHAAKLKISVGG
jgi:hypothetical protein